MRPLRIVFACLLAACAGLSSPGGKAPPIDVEPLRGTELYRVVSNGLEPEVAVEGLRRDQVAFGRDVLEATLAALEQGPTPGAAVPIHLGPALARVQLASAAGNVLLVVDQPPVGAEAHPVAALATAAFARALDAWQDGDTEAASRLAAISIELHPGDPLEARASAPVQANAQNHLAWALQARLEEGSAGERAYVAALERSPAWMEAQLGGSPAALQEPDRQELQLLAARLVEANLAALQESGAREGASGVLELPSPIRSGGAPAGTILLPAPFLQLYALPPGASLLQDEAWRQVAIEAFERLRAVPAELLLATREIRGLYLPGDLLLPAPPGEGDPAEKMLSALLADVARKAVAGLSPEEVGATLGADMPPQVAGTAARKLLTWREREAGWFAEALRESDR